MLPERSAGTEQIGESERKVAFCAVSSSRGRLAPRAFAAGVLFAVWFGPTGQAVLAQTALAQTAQDPTAPPADAEPPRPDAPSAPPEEVPTAPEPAPPQAPPPSAPGEAAPDAPGEQEGAPEISQQPAAAEGQQAPDAASEAPTQPTAVAGYFPDEGFALKSTDGQFKLRIGLQAAYRFEPRWRNGEELDRPSFFVLRPLLEGHLYRPWIRFWTSFEFASNPPFLLDSFLELQPIDEFGVRFGQQYTPYSRHEYFGPQQILFPEWSVVADYFWSGRDKGVTALGSVGGGVLEYFAGVYSGSPLRQFTTIHGNYVVIGRVTWSPLGPAASSEAPYITNEDGVVPFRISMTGQAYYGEKERAAANFNPSTFRFDVAPTGERTEQATAGGDIWLEGGPLVFFAEANVRRTTPNVAGAEEFTSVGVWGQAAMMIVPRFLDLGVRVNWLDAVVDQDDDRLLTVEGQVGYYPFQSQRLVLKLRYGYADQQDPGTEDGRLALPPGDYHLATLQVGMAF
jgi:hypothetical protein